MHMANKKGENTGYSYRYNKSGTVSCRKYFTMPDGYRKQLFATGGTKGEARDNLDIKYTEICKNGKQICSKGYTVETWLNYWLKNIKINLKGNTKDSYYDSFKNHIIPQSRSFSPLSYAYYLYSPTYRWPRSYLSLSVYAPS